MHRLLLIYTALSYSARFCQAQDCLGSPALCGIIEEFENIARDLATTVEDLIRDLRDCSINCRSCSHMACESDPIKKADTFCELTSTDECLACTDERAQGILLDTKNSVVMFPEGVTYDDSYENQASVCMGRNVNEVFQKYEDSVAFAGTGFYTGVYRSYPGKPQNTCGTYDPRIRPWYVAASSGPKDVMLVLDVSGSMAEQERITLAIEAAKSVIGTLTFADYFGVTVFDSDARYLSLDFSGDHLYSATAANKESIIRKLDELQPGSMTNFVAGFTKAFAAMQNPEFTSHCHSIMIFLTDGEPTQGATDESTIVNSIKNLQDDAVAAGKERANIFTFSLGYGADQDIPKAIACDNRGVWKAIQDQSQDLKTSMSAYYQLLALGLDAVDTVRFVEPYEFKFTGILGTSASIAVFDKMTVPPKFWGVVAAGLPIAEMQKVEPEYQSILNSLLYSSAQCPDITISDDELEQLRYESHPDSVCVAVPGQLIELRPRACNEEIYPSWDSMVCNLDGMSKSFPDRACCEPTCGAERYFGSHKFTTFLSIVAMVFLVYGI